jgi:hypothetical protein
MPGYRRIADRLQTQRVIEPMRKGFGRSFNRGKEIGLAKGMKPAGWAWTRVSLPSCENQRATGRSAEGVPQEVQ